MVKMRWRSASRSSKTVSSQCCPRVAAISLRRLPAYCRFSGRSKPTGMTPSGPMPCASGSQSAAGARTSARLRSRGAGARRIELVRRGRAHWHAFSVLAQRPAAEERAEVGRDAARDHRVEPIAEASPALGARRPVADERAVFRRQVAEGVLNAAAGGRRGPPLAQDLSSDALSDLREGARIVHQWEVRVAEDIDEAGAGDHTARLQHLPRRLGGGGSPPAAV